MIVYVLCAHLLGDFYFQWSTLAKAKQTQMRALVFHMLVYMLTFIGVGVLVDQVVLMILLGFVHALVDFLFFKNRNNAKGIVYTTVLAANISYLFQRFIYGREELVRYDTSNESRNLFLLDQVIHIGLLILLTLRFGESTLYNPSFEFSVLLIYKPASVLIKNLTSRYQVESDGVVSGAGSLIGYMERTIMLVSLMTKEPSIMVFGFGFVLTAKTISRYGKTREDENFAQYFVIGTMMSILITLAAYVLMV